ncbi:penicillin-binding protein 1C [Hufsiella ginkgonis]|uniref:peptidoglycan glycosyltransferase n=1 Tax=Hufsiella ginkgonis TaxID=2695274 RepID=A0A7K1XXK4_9SPHI|nr:penicillin-binding protein 1C [Hufsiella ginkgonis]MXV15558.1 penicillin-binding protein 1C [Hufsiella ginkgonis]
MKKILDLKRRRTWYLLTAVLLAIAFWFSLPDPLFTSPYSYVIEDSKGVLLGASIAADGQWRFQAGGKVPVKFGQCIIAFEDTRFRYHPGFDPIAMARAIRQNSGKQRIISGGSTLTMQVIRLSRQKRRNLWQKLVEVILAVRLELTYSKDEILGLYAANAPFGTNVIGLDAASWRYFGRGPANLSWGEAATLAVLPNAPSLIHPGRNRERLRLKRNRLLDKLVRQHVIDKGTAALAKLEPIPDRPLPLPRRAPHLLDRFKKDFASSDSARVKTTLDGDLQRQVNAVINRYHQQFKANGINNAAALVVEVETGNVLAYVGNISAPGDTEMQGDVDMIPALRSPGSTLKPLLYASMLAGGQLLPDALIPDIPTQIGGYSPRNFDLGYDGAIPASRALSRSLNIPAVKMLQQYKYQRFYQQLKRLGITSLNKPADFYGLSLILGGCETSMWELSGVYASMARTLDHYGANHAKYDPNDFRMPRYISGRQPARAASPVAQGVAGIDYASAWFTFNAMQEVMRPGEEGLWQQFASSRKVAWKTGTSFGFRDGWAIGLTPSHVICVWVGNADGEGRPGLTGIETAAPVLFELFNLLPASGWFEGPADFLVQVPVCRQSGYRAGPNCPDKEQKYIPAAGIKTSSCPWHQLVHLDQTGRFQVSSECESPSAMIHRPWFVLPPAMEYYYKLRHSDYLELPPFKPGCPDAGATRQMELIYPKNDAKVYIPIEISGERGNVIFNAAHRMRHTRIFWHLDDQYLATTTDFHQVSLSPPPGKHTITLVDEKGNRLVQVFEVLDKEKDR